MLMPLLLRLDTPYGVSDWHADLPERSQVEVRALSAAEVRERVGELGLAFPDAECGEGEAEEAPGAETTLASARPGGYQLTLRSSAGLDYATLRPLRRLRPGDMVHLTETYTDRLVVRYWRGCVVTEVPDTFDYVGEARGSEFYRAALALIFAGELT